MRASGREHADWSVCRLILGFLASAAVSLVSSAAMAHPHVFITTAISFVFTGEHVSGVRIQWSFDPVYSSTFQMDFDLDGDGVFNAEEVANIDQNGFVNLRDYHFLSYLWVNEEEVADIEPQEFDAAMDESGALVFRFVVPLPEPLDPRKGTVSAEMVDRENYFDMALSEEPVSLENAPSLPCSVSIADDLENPYYFGLLIAKKVILSCAS